MLKSHTLFVVGAGASAELGLPTGHQLKLLLSGNLDIQIGPGQNVIAGKWQIREAYRMAASRNQWRPDQLQAACRRISAAMPAAVSIDTYLETHHRDPQTVLCGKLGIALTILEAERESSLYFDDMAFRINRKTPDSWLIPLVQMLQSRVRLEDVRSVLSRTKFIIFNYDRCVEHFLYHWIQLHYGVSEAESASIVNMVEIYHPYGRVGRLPWQSGNEPAVPFGCSAEPAQLLQIAQSIRTYSEQVDDRDVVAGMHDALRASVNVVFLGFSYGGQNMELLTPRERGDTGRVYGTTLGMPVPALDIVDGQLCSAFSLPIGTSAVTLSSVSSAQLLYDYSRVLAHA